jgi:glc operon protein GlcG
MKNLVAAMLFTSVMAGAARADVTTMRESINSEGAKKIVNICEEMAQARHWRLAIWVLDITGQPLYMATINDPTSVAVITAQMKARTALTAGAPSETRAANFATPDRARAAQALDYYPVAGGLPIMRSGKVIGAVGVGGLTPENGKSMDAACAQAGIDAAIQN